MSTSPTIPRKEFSKFSYSVLDTCIMNSFEILTKMGGYIILFSILAELLQLLPISNLCLCISSGFLEITTGIHQIATLPLFFHKKIALIAAITSFGGLSGLAQTKSAISDSGLSLIPYVLVKILSACFAFCFTFLFYIV